MSTKCDRCGNARCGWGCENWEAEQNLAYSLANPTLPLAGKEEA